MSDQTVRSIDGILRPPTVTTSLPKKKRRYFLILKKSHLTNKKSLLLLGLLIIGISVSSWFFFIRTTNAKDLFTTQLASSVQFPLYYPEILPPGFTIDRHSVAEPQAGVIVFDVVGKNNQKIYISEEATPSGFNFNGLYDLDFTEQATLPNTPYDSIAGILSSSKNQVVSINTGKTWILITSVEHFSNHTLSAMARSITLSNI